MVARTTTLALLLMLLKPVLVLQLLFWSRAAITAALVLWTAAAMPPPAHKSPGRPLQQQGQRRACRGWVVAYCRRIQSHSWSQRCLLRQERCAVHSDQTVEKEMLGH